MTSSISSFMTKNGYDKRQISQFNTLISSLSNEEKEIEWENVKSPKKDKIIPLSSLNKIDQSKLKSLLNEIVICKLNGGLGTSMGCKGSKSKIIVKENKSFLDLAIEQISVLNAEYAVNIPLILMNSFNTDADTKKIIESNKQGVNILTFCQNQFPRVFKDGLELLDPEKYKQQAFYPPGHGDFYNSIQDSGLLDELKAKGKKYIFVSNIDNLGATLSLEILQFFAEKESTFLMEVTPKTPLDVKGGTLIEYQEKPLQLLEIAQVPSNNIEDFQNIEKFRVFNTNNIWINIEGIQKELQGGIHLDVIKNEKKVGEKTVIQLETALGAAISLFQNSVAIEVSRARFLPVKTTSDLFLIQSNLYLLEKGSLVLNPKRTIGELPQVRFGKQLTLVGDFQARFPDIPDLIELNKLEVDGDVSFGVSIKLLGDVKILAKAYILQVPDHSVIQNTTVRNSKDFIT